MLALPGFRWLTKPFLGSRVNYSHPLAKGVLHDWLMNDGDGPNVGDTALDQRAVKLAGGAAWVSGRDGSAVSFNGSTAYGQATNVDLSSSSTLTIAFWYLRTTAYNNSDSILFESSASYYNHNGILVNPDSSGMGGGRFQFGIGGSSGGSYGGIPRPSTGSWHHFVFCFDRSLWSTDYGLRAGYVDNVLQTVTGGGTDSSAGTGNFNTSDTLNFAARNGGSSLFCPGTLGRVTFWNRCLSAAEVGELYSAEYAFYQAPALRRFYAVLSGSLSAVGLSSTDLWNDQARVGKSGTDLWDVSATVGHSSTELWDDLARIGRSETNLWDDLVRIGLSNRDLWNLFSTVGLSRAELWDDQVRVGLARTELWDLAARVGLSGTDLWGVGGFIGRSSTTLWNDLVRVGLVRTNLWDDLTRVGLSERDLWGVRAASGLSEHLDWTTRALAGKSGTSLWNDRVSVGGSRTYDWDVLAKAALLRTLLWNTAANAIPDIVVILASLYVNRVVNLGQFVDRINPIALNLDKETDITSQL